MCNEIGLYYEIGLKILINYAIIVYIITKGDKFLKPRAHNNPSWDILHNITPERWGDYYLIPDLFLITNTLLFIPELYNFDKYMLNSAANVFISLHWIRVIAIFLTAMPSPAKNDRAYGFSTSAHDLILSGHNIQSLLTTLIITQVTQSSLILYTSWLCAIGNIFSAILNRHHYTIDVYLTIIVVYLTHQQYLVPID
uniref:Sphingomyelin synthase-like domain-containing protein n=1 Tax=viral metagenome TaxID=1070528 RepID=A0A6C0E7S5_9ZZZZ